MSIYQKSSFLTLILKFLAAALFFLSTLPQNGSEQNSESLLLFYSTEWKSELFSLPLKGSEGNFESLLLFMFHRRNSELFSLLWNSLEGNSESSLLFANFFIPWNGILSFFLFVEGFGTKFRDFSVPRNSRNSVEKKHLFRLFHLPRTYIFVGNSQP